MKYICRFIIFICLFFISLSANAFSDNSQSYISRHIDTIVATQVNDFDVLYSNTGNATIQGIQRNDNLTINNKETDNSFDGELNNFLHQSDCQFKDLISYIYTQSYLRNKTKVSLLKVLSEINPNAP